MWWAKCRVPKATGKAGKGQELQFHMPHGKVLLTDRGAEPSGRDVGQGTGCLQRAGGRAPPHQKRGPEWCRVTLKGHCDGGTGDLQYLQPILSVTLRSWVRTTGTALGLPAAGKGAQQGLGSQNRAGSGQTSGAESISLS